MFLNVLSSAIAGVYECLLVYCALFGDGFGLGRHLTRNPHLTRPLVNHPNNNRMLRSRFVFVTPSIMGLVCNM